MRVWSLWPVVVLTAAVSCKAPSIMPTEFERVSAEACECSVDKPTRSKSARPVPGMPIGFSESNLAFQLGVVPADLAPGLSLLDWVNLIADRLAADAGADRATILDCSEIESDGRPTILCDADGPLSHLGVVKTPTRLLFVVINAPRTVPWQQLARRLFFSVRSTEPKQL